MGIATLRRYRVRKEAQAMSTATTEDIKKESTAIEPKERTLAELKAEALAKGLEIPPKATKAILVALLEGGESRGEG